MSEEGARYLPDDEIMHPYVSQRSREGHYDSLLEVYVNCPSLEGNLI